MTGKELFRLTWLPVLTASLCCLTPVALVLLGLGTVSFAAAVSDILYGEYDWIFLLAGVVLLALSVVSYLRHQKGICTLNDAKQRRNEVINIVASI